MSSKKVNELDVFQEDLFSNVQYSNEIVKLCDIHRDVNPIETRVELDEGTAKANTCFDFDFDGISKFHPFIFNKLIRELKFKSLVITGASGSGKSTFSKYFGEEEKLVWDNSKAIINNFSSLEEAINKLSLVGLEDKRVWCRPRNVLSVGEGFRVDLARRIKSNCVIDEFTSTVDRDVARSCSRDICKFINDNNLTNCVFVSCHKDFIDDLRPDYVIDLDDECIYDTRALSDTLTYMSMKISKNNKLGIYLNNLVV